VNSNIVVIITVIWKPAFQKIPYDTALVVDTHTHTHRDTGMQFYEAVLFPDTDVCCDYRVRLCLLHAQM